MKYIGNNLRHIVWQKREGSMATVYHALKNALPRTLELSLNKSLFLHSLYVNMECLERSLNDRRK